MSIAPGETETYWFAVKFYQPENSAPEIIQQNIKDRMEDAEKTTRNKLAWAYNQLPKFSRPINS